jgi:hypothetical protein
MAVGYGQTFRIGPGGSRSGLVAPTERKDVQAIRFFVASRHRKLSAGCVRVIRRARLLLELQSRPSALCVRAHLLRKIVERERLHDLIERSNLRSRRG